MTETTPRRKRFPIIRRIWRNWRSRHQDPRNFAIHLIGIPLAVAGVIALFFLPWYWGVAGLVLGYLLPWVRPLLGRDDVGGWGAGQRLGGFAPVATLPPFPKPSRLPSPPTPP